MRRKMNRRYGNMGLSYRILSEACGSSKYLIMKYVRLLEPIMKELD